MCDPNLSGGPGRPYQPNSQGSQSAGDPSSAIRLIRLAPGLPSVIYVNLAIDIKDSAGGGTGRPVRSVKLGCVRVGAVGVLFVACWGDFLYLALADHPGSPWLLLFALVIGLAALLWPERRRPGWLTPQVRTDVPALVAGVHVLILTVAGQTGGFGPGQAAVLLCLLMTAVRTCPPAWALVCGLLDGVVLLALPASGRAPERGSRSGGRRGRSRRVR